MMSEQARHCYRKFERIAAIAVALEEHLPENDGWSVVVRFYAALHLMNAYLLDKKNETLNLKSTAHDLRKKAMEACPELRDAPKKYRDLKDLSENIRYNPEFAFAPHHREESISILAKIVAIVDPKIKKN